jgi:uncharacterized protein YbjT (DUF2867 family)
MAAAVAGERDMTQSSNAYKLVTIFGGSGFIGRHVVRALARRDYRIRVAVRRPDLAGFLQPLGRVGQIHAVQANVRYPDSVAAAVQDSDIVINLVGILNQRGRQRFKPVHLAGTEAIARATAQQGARLIQVSALPANERSWSGYARTKGRADKAALAAVPAAVVFRPSIVFGPEDKVFNRFAALARLLPALPLVGGGKTKFQPVFVGDVAEAIAAAVDGKAKPGAIYELGGSETFTFKQLLQFILATIGRRRLLVPIPFWLARLQALFLQFLPNPLLTPDQVTLLKRDNMVSEEATRDGRTLGGLGIEPRSVQSIVPSYLWRFRKTGQFRPRSFVAPRSPS